MRVRFLLDGSRRARWPPRAEHEAADPAAGARAVTSSAKRTLLFQPHKKRPAVGLAAASIRIHRRHIHSSTSFSTSPLPNQQAAMMRPAFSCAAAIVAAAAAAATPSAAPPLALIAARRAFAADSSSSSSGGASKAGSGKEAAGEVREAPGRGQGGGGPLAPSRCVAARALLPLLLLRDAVRFPSSHPAANQSYMRPPHHTSTHMHTHNMSGHQGGRARVQEGRRGRPPVRAGRRRRCVTVAVAHEGSSSGA